MKGLEILYEDDFILVINKPAGLAVQGGEGVKVSVDKLAAQMVAGTGSQMLSDAKTPLLVHRLDKDTSGVLLLAKGREEAARFSRLISGRKTIKKYTAVCAGKPEKNEGVIKDSLLIHGSLKESETKYKVLKTFNDYAVLELELVTGRMHQIRRHLASCKNPVLGDDKYGDFKLNKSLRKTAGLNHLLLHASRLIIKTDYHLDIAAPLPEYFKKYDV